MSYLLDALRKSEDLKKRGAAPTIHTAGRYDKPGRASHWLGMALLVLLPLLVLLAWYSWSDHDSLTEPSPQGHTGLEDGLATSSQSSPAKIQSEQAAAGQAERPVSKPATITLSTERTPVERIDNAPGSSPADKPAEAVADRDNTKESTSDSIAQPQVEAPSAAEEASSGGTPDRLDDGNGEPRDYQPAMPGLIHVWELPESIRGNLMDMRISVLVFAERPEDRFILMNGKRWAEGDEPQPGLVIREIRREGVVFTYRLYRFLVSR